MCRFLNTSFFRLPSSAATLASVSVPSRLSVAAVHSMGARWD